MKSDKIVADVIATNDNEVKNDNKMETSQTTNNKIFKNHDIKKRQQYANDHHNMKTV